MQQKIFSIGRSLAVLTALTAVTGCESADKNWLQKYDYFAANPPRSKEQLLADQPPGPKAQQAVAHSQAVLDQMANYDRPVTEPMPRGEGGLISNFSLPSSGRNNPGSRLQMIGQSAPPAAESAKRATRHDPRANNPRGAATAEPQSSFTPPVVSDTAVPPAPAAIDAGLNIVSAPPAMPAPEPAPTLSAPPPTATTNDDAPALQALRLALETSANQAVETPPATNPTATETNSAGPTAAVPPNDYNVDINFNNTSLRTVIEFVFGQYIKQPYSIASDFQDKEVNWIVQGNFTPAQTKRLFDAFLDVQGAVVAWQNGFYTIANKTGQQRVGSGGEMGLNMGVWHLRSLDAAEALQAVRPFLASPENAQTIARTNILIVNGTTGELQAIDNFLRSVDVDNFKDKRVLVYAPEHISAEGLTTLLQALPQQLGMNTSEGKKQIEAAVISGAKRVVIVTDNPETRDVVLQYLRQVDRPGRRQRQVFYYGLRNQTVDDVRSTLTSLLPGIIPDAADITVVANAPTNSLVIGATADQYYEIKKVIDRLDYRVPSVMIDTTIVEVQLNENLAYGVEWFLGGRLGRVRGDITTDLTNAAAIPTPAARIGVVSLANNTFATLDLLASETNLRVLSRPRVIVKNKATATIKSTDQVRIVKSVLTTNAQQGGSNLPQREFEDKEVGVSLQVTPRIAEDGTVNMAVKIQDSRQGATDNSSGEPQPTFNIREVNTELVSKNGNTMMIGGLIRNTNSRVKRKVPFLGDLPFLGQAFANTNDVDQRTELIVFLTPYLVVDELSARLVSEALSNLAQLNPTTATNTAAPELDLTTPANEKPKLPEPPPPPPEPANKQLSPTAVETQPTVMIPPPPPPIDLLDETPATVPAPKPATKLPPPSLADDPAPSPVPESRAPGLPPIAKPLLQ